MLSQEPDGQPLEKPKKEMLTWTKTPTGHHVRINYSSLELIQTCLRKAHYSLNRNLKPADESEALAFGSAIHKGLEHWYQLDPKERELPKALHEEADLMAAGQNLEAKARHGALEAIRQFVMSRREVLSRLPQDDKRSLASGVRILKAYFKHYANDGFIVASDDKGPLIERTFSFRLADSPHLAIDYFGTIDVILRNTDTGLLVVCDHKTTASLGKEFYDRCRPNFQYSGYVAGAKKALGVNTNLFLINGIQTLKTKTEFARQITERTEDDFHELEIAVGWRVNEWLHATKHDCYPQTTPNPCSMYGGCQYRGICEVPAAIKGNVIEARYGRSQ